MTSLDRRNHISRGEAAIPGEVRRWRAFWLLAVAFFMMIVDLTIVNVALPTIGRKLHFPESDLQWVVTAYALTFGGFLLLGGRAADLLGRRRLFMAGLAIFTAASLACALATTDTFLIIMRGIQGLGAAALLLARRVVPESRLRGARRSYDPLGAVTVTGGLVMLVYAISQAPAVGWTAPRTMVPLAAAAALLAGFLIVETRAEAPLL